jgi:hypothetical protein
MPKKKNNENKNSVILMYAVLGAIVFILGMIIVLTFFH